MNKETLKGDWNIVKGKVKEKWGKLTDDDLTEIQGRRDQLLGIIEKKYGIAKEKAEEEVKTWEKSYYQHTADGEEPVHSHYKETKKH